MTPRSREFGRALLMDDAIGTLTHRTLGVLLRQDEAFTLGEVREVVRVFLPPALASTYQQSIQQRVGSAVARYQAEFRENSWRLIEPEFIAEDAALDLLWRLPDGSVAADEIKTGANAGIRMTQHERQCSAQVSAGRAVFGNRFRGVRLVLLADSEERWFGTRSVEGVL